MVRYEFGGTGFFHAIPLLWDCKMEESDEEDLEYAIQVFERELPVPEYTFTKTQAFFTTEGAEYFYKPIEIFCTMFRKYGESAGIGVLKEIREAPLGKVFYSDKFQIVFEA